MSTRISPGRLRVAYYRAHFLESIRPDGIVCLECGKLRKTLGTHVATMHHMTLDDYRERWGFNRQTVFIAADTAAHFRRLALQRNLGAAGSAEHMAKVRAARRPGSLPRRAEARIRISEAKKRLYATGWQPRRHRKVDDRTLRRLARDGLDTKRIARKAGLSIDQTRNRLQALGLLPPRRRRRLLDRERILALRREGLWPLEIARRLRLKPQVVRKTLWLLRGQGIKVPTPSRPRPIKRRRVADDVFLAAFRRGGTTAEIAARLGVSRDYVLYKTHYLRQRGLIAPASRSRRSRKGRRAARQAEHSP
jgi:AraC-like DNA-binding protein